MKVIELIDILKEYPDDMEVVAHVTKLGLCQNIKEREETGFDVQERDGKIVIDIDGVYFH